MGTSSSFIINKRARRVTGALFLLVAGLVAAVIFSGCQKKEAVRETGADDLLRQAVTRTEKLNNYHFNSVTEIGRPGKTKKLAISGNWQSSDRLKMTIKSQGLEQKVIMIGKEMFTKTATETTWHRTGGDLQEQRKIASTLRILKDFKSASFANETGAERRRINAVYDLATFTGKSLEDAETQKVVARLQLDKSGYIKMATIKQKNIKAGNSSIDFFMEITLGRYNQSGEVKPPTTASSTF